MGGPRPVRFKDACPDWMMCGGLVARPLFDVLLEHPIAVGVAQFAQGLGFDLTDPFAGYIENLTDFLEGLHAALVQAVVQAQHIALVGGRLFHCY